MKISIAEDNSTFKPVEVTEDTLPDIITKHTYSLATFKDNHRTNANYQQVPAIGLDFDDGLSIEDARDVFKDYKHIIGPTRNHRKPKNGVVADRFRVILFLSEPITDRNVYLATIGSLLEQFPAADRACKDPARMFYPCTVVDKYVKSGKLIDPVPATERPPSPSLMVELKGRGRLLQTTYDFLMFGADQNWNHRLYAAAKDLQQQGYSREEAEEILVLATLRYEGRLDGADKKSIESAFNTPPNDTPRPASAFNFKNMKQLREEKPQMNWVIDGLLSEGGISVIAGPPKSGKSTIIRQLAVAVAKDQSFLGRDVARGQILYLALEEQEAMLYKQFTALGVSDTDPITFHVGPLNRRNGMDDFKEYLLASRPKIAVIDTLVLFAQIQDDNNYKEVYNALTIFRDLARQTGTHIVCIHHSNKSGGVMGSTAFTGAVDAIINFENVGGKRYISTQGRGTIDFRRQPLEFCEEAQAYLLGEHNDGF